MPDTTTYALTPDGLGPIEVTVTEHGEGRPILLLHGGGGPQTVAAFAEQLASARDARVLVPVHPGFDGTPRPEALHDIAGLATIHLELLDRLDLDDVVVVGNSVGGWIAAEMALRHPSRVSGIVLVDAVGIEVPGHPIVDFFALPIQEIADYSYHEPDRFRIDPGALPPAAREILAGNRAALEAYAGRDMADPALRGRLGGVNAPTLVVWGESDRIAGAGYGRALADAIPGAEFRLLPATGHLPQIETPAPLIDLVGAFACARAGTGPASARERAARRPLRR